MALRDDLFQAGWMVRIALVALCMLALVPAFADAAPAGCGGNGSEIARLKRQIAANDALRRKYSCEAGATTFACRELAGRIAKVSATLASLQPAACTAVAEKPAVVPMRKKVAEARPALVPTETARIQTMCVRLSDGYYFPTPNSGYLAADRVQSMAAQCRFICEDADMDVFRVTGETRLPEDMVSLTDGKRYGDMSTSGAYRRAAAARACDMNRFYKSVLDRIPPLITQVEAVAPVEPTLGVATLSPDTMKALFVDIDLRGSRSVLPEPQRSVPSRKVRIVGAAYLPTDL